MIEKVASYGKQLGILTDALLALTGDARVRYRDSAVVTISPRNRAR